MILKIIGRAEDYKGANTHYKLNYGRTVIRKREVRMHENGILLTYNIIPEKV